VGFNMPFQVNLNFENKYFRARIEKLQVVGEILSTVYFSIALWIKKDFYIFKAKRIMICFR
jgi:hypothetical protein